MSEIKYKRVLLKLSGEALAGDQKTGVNPEIIGKICDQVKVIVDMGVEVSIVVGGGNFWRGRYGLNMERTTSDYMGMLATAMNGLALQDALESKGLYTRLQTAIEMREIAEPYIKRKALKHLERNRVVIFACGSGNPFFTTSLRRSFESLLPLMMISPEVGVSSCMISLRKVLLPAPEAPTMNTNSPLSMLRLTSWRAWVPLG